jgi:GntR family transcriptional regulator
MDEVTDTAARLENTLGAQSKLRSDPRPLYVLAEDALRKLQVSLGLGPGDRLPPEVELARLLGVSRSTIREALRILELNGEVRRVHGLGTLVAHRPREIVAGIEVLESLDSLAERQGWVCGTVDVGLTAVPLPPPAAQAMGLPEGGDAVMLERTKTRDGARIAYMQSILPAEVISLEELSQAFTGSIIDSLLHLGKPQLEFAVTHIRMDPAPMDVARQLHIDQGMPLLVLEETCCDAADTPFCYNLNWFLPGSVRLDLVRRPR